VLRLPNKCNVYWFIDKGIIGSILGVRWHGNKQLVSFSLLSLYLFPSIWLPWWWNCFSYHETMANQTCMNDLVLMNIVYTNLYSIKQIPIPFNCAFFRFLGLGKIERELIIFCSIWMVTNCVRNFIYFDVAIPFHWAFPLFCFAPTFGIIYHGGRKLKSWCFEWIDLKSKDLVKWLLVYQNISPMEDRWIKNRN